MSINPRICNNIPGWFPPPAGYGEIIRTFGHIIIADGKIMPLEWESEHMVIVRDLPGCPKPLYVNKQVLPMLREALRLCVALNDGYVIRTIGCFNPRNKRSDSSSASLHSWGVAFDINGNTNPPLRIHTPSDWAMRKKDIPDEWIQCFESVGFMWGGRFTAYFDPMHFQYASGY